LTYFSRLRALAAKNSACTGQDVELYDIEDVPNPRLPLNAFGLFAADRRQDESHRHGGVVADTVCRAYARRTPEHGVLYRVVLQTILWELDRHHDERGTPLFVKREFQRFVRCGLLAGGNGDRRPALWWCAQPRTLVVNSLSRSNGLKGKRRRRIDGAAFCLKLFYAGG
jgi:hypothetical protein